MVRAHRTPHGRGVPREAMRLEAATAADEPQQVGMLRVPRDVRALGQLCRQRVRRAATHDAPTAAAQRPEARAAGAEQSTAVAAVAVAQAAAAAAAVSARATTMVAVHAAAGARVTSHAAAERAHGDPARWARPS